MHSLGGLQSGYGSRSSTGTSRSLIDRVRANDADAWNRLVSLYAPLVHSWCRRWRLGEEDAADVFQEVFQAVTGHIARFRCDRDSDTFRGWLRTITLHKIHDLHRKRGGEPRAAGGSEALQRLARFPAPADDDASASGSAARAESTDDDTLAERRLFQRALALIRDDFEPRTWQAFWRTAVDGRSAADVGAELSMSPGAVRVAKSRVLQRLREELGDLGM